MADQNEIQSAVLSYLGDKKQETTQSLRVSFDTALGVNPDQEAGLRKTASVLNIPVDAAREHPEEVRRQATMLTTDFDNIANQYPNTARFLAKQENANIAHDDVPNMSNTEKVLGALNDLKGDAIAGAYSASRGAAGIFRAGFELAAPVLDPLTGTILPENPLRRVAAGFDALGQSADAGAKANRPKSEGIISSGINSGIESLSQNLLALPLAFVPGGQSAYLSSMVAPVAGNAYSDAREKGISPTESAVYGASQGLIEYATEKLPVQYLIKDLKVGSPFYKVIAHQMASEIPGEQIATILQDLNEWAVINPDKPFSDYIAERPSAAAQTLIATVVGVGGQVTLAKGAQKLTDQFTGQSDQVRRAEYSADLLNQLNTLATASKLRTRDTDSFQTFLQSALEDGEVDHVYIEPQVLMQTLEQAGIKMEDFAQTSPLVSAQLQESLATNTDLSIPITEFATQLAGQTYSQQLIQHLKTDPQGMSQIEAQEFIKTHGENLKTEVERILGESSQSQEFKASRDRVYQLVLDNLNETNRFTQQKNEIDATLISARTAVRAAQLGITPEDLFNKHLLKVTADTVAGDQVLQQPGQSAFGKKYEQFKGKAAQAVAHLKQAKSGEAIGALNHPEIGPIDLIWGEEGDAKNDYAGGYGLAKILAKHPELENKLQDILDGMTVKTKGKNRIILESKDHKSAISLNWKGQEKKWLLSAYEKGERGASGTTIYAAKDSQEGDSLPNAPEDIVDRILSDFNKSSYNQSNPVFYSGLAKAVLAAKQATAPAKDWLPIINSLPGVKKEEIEWSGIKDYLTIQGKEKLTKEQVAQFINENGVQLNEKLLGDSRSEGERAQAAIAQYAESRGYTFDDRGPDGYSYLIDDETGDTIAEGEAQHIAMDLGLRLEKEGITKYGKWTLPGGENYKELLITLPEQGGVTYTNENVTAIEPQKALTLEEEAEYKSLMSKDIFEMTDAEVKRMGDLGSIYTKIASDPDRFWYFNAPEQVFQIPKSKYKTEAEAKAYILREKQPEADPKSNYKSSHWDDLNVLAHIRFNDRTDSEGNKVLFVEEIQSDWHQAGRKKGYRGDMSIDQARQKMLDNGYSPESVANSSDEDIVKMMTQYGVPNAPLKDTKAWTALAVKRITRYAAENGYDNVAFVNGEQAADRFDLSKQINSLDIERDVDPSGAVKNFKLTAYDQDANQVINKTLFNLIDLEDHVGKSLAEKIKDDFANNREHFHSYSGLDLKVGGEGMEGFYDKILPKVVNDVLKKVGGGKIEPIQVQTKDSLRGDQQFTYMPVTSLPSAYTEDGATYSVQDQDGNEVATGFKDADEARNWAKAHDPMLQSDQLGFTLTPEIREAVMSGQTLFQAQRGQIAFGSDLSKSPSIITLLKSADLSTFLHESGHFFFESDINLAADLNRTAVEMGASFLTEGERQLMNDVSKMLEWHGLQGSLNDQLNQWYTLSPEEKRSYHERTAESFERYLFEGKAPSIELQRIFQAFRAWLMNVYKSIEDFVARNPEAGKLDDSIRQVFDRMLASSEQIQLAEQGRSMMPLFESADQAGMTTEEFAAYHALDLDASMQALSALEAKGLKDMQWLHNARGKIIKKLQKQNVARRAEVMMDARREVLSQPIYKAWTFLTNRMDKDQKIVPDALPKSDKDTVTPEVDSMFTAIAKLGGLKRDEIDTLMGLDPKMKSPMPAFGKYVFKRNGGESLDFMGEILANYGYLTVDEHGKFDTRELEDKIDAELRGDPQYAVGVDPRLLGQEGRAGEGLNLEELGAGRLDFGELVGLPLPREQINQLEAMKMVAINGIHPDLVAEQFGISSGDELVQSILSMPNPKEAIANLTDQMMLERYGDITSPEALQQAADVAIHNEARAKFVATELNALNKVTGKPKVLTSAAKEFAKNMIDRLIIRNLKPSPYAASEVRAAKAAEKALKEGKLEQAAADKRNQIINTYATKAVYDAQDEVEKGLRYLTKFDNEGTRKALDVDYLDQIDAILERFDLRKGTTLKNIDKRKSLAAWITQQEELGIEVDLPSKVKAEAYRQSYKDMTVEELRGLIESVKQIEHLGRLKEKLLTAQDNRKFSEIINQMVQSVEESSNNRHIDNRTRDTIGNKAVRLFKGFFAAHRKTASLARELDGYKESGPMWEYLIRSMNQAGDHEATMRADATHRLSALLEPILKGGKFGGKGQYFPTLKESLNRGEQIVIALNMGNAGNQQRLLDGRGWQIEQLTPVMKSLTAADWNFVQNIWDFFESYRPMIAEKERRVMGKEPNWVEPQRLTVTTKEGTQLDLKGGYFPIVYDPRESGRAEQFADAEAAKQMMRGAFNAATTRRSFTKDRAEEVTGRPLILTWDALFRGVNDVIHDLTWHEWVIDANRIIKNESLDNAIRTGFGADVIAQFKSAITDIAKGDSPDMDAMSKVLTPLRSGAAVAGLGFNLMNSMLQPLGLTQSMVRIGTRWVGLGIVEWAKSPIGLVKQVHEKSEFMRNRARTLNREVNEVQSIVQGKGEIREKLDALMFAPMQSLQLVADMPTWWGAYQKALADPALMDAENGVDEATAIARADQAVIDSQGGGQIKDLAKVQRGGNLQKLFTVFYGYFSAAYNLGVDQTKKTNFKSPVEVMALAWDFLLLYSVPSVLASLLKDALMPSGAGDDDWEKIARKLASEQISYLMGLMVGLREATGAVQYITGTKMFDTAYGGPAGLRFFQELDKLGKQIGQGDLDRALARSVINVGGIALHLPSAQINRTVDGVIALSEGKTENPLAVLFGYSKQ